MSRIGSRFLVAVLGIAIGVPILSGTSPALGQDVKVKPIANTVSSVHDFDFFVGSWHVQHRRLTDRLANSHEWINFEGTTVTQSLLGGLGNVDDNVLNFPEGTYRAVTLRAFDAKSALWSIWWLDGRSPSSPIDPPMKGSFHDGFGTFYADDTFHDKAIRVRFIWSRITPTSCHWEQAYSSDDGKSWETNWYMDFTRDEKTLLEASR